MGQAISQTTAHVAQKCYALATNAITSLSSLISDVSRKVQKAGKDIVDAFVNADLRQIPFDMTRWIKGHPILTLSHITRVLLIFVPGFLWLPALQLLGFGANGILAGFLAPRLQARLNPGAVVMGIWGAFANLIEVDNEAEGGVGGGRVEGEVGEGIEVDVVGEAEDSRDDGEN